MTYGYEEPVMMPTMSVYDTSLAQAYIAGLREQYNQLKEDMKDFIKQYQDFRSDIAGANEEYHNETTGRINNALNLMISNGIDPLRSAEGRAAISRLIYTTNTKKLKDLEQLKENYDIYRKALAEGIANGTVDEKAENFFLEQLGLLKRDQNGNIIPFTAMDGDLVRRWDRLAPTKYQSLHDLTATEFDKLQAEEMLKSDRPGYIKKGVSEANMNAATDASMRLLDNTPWGQFYRRLAEELAGPGASKEQVDAMLRRMIKDQNVKQAKYEVDPYYSMDYQHDLKLKEMQKQHDLNELSADKEKKRLIEIIQEKAKYSGSKWSHSEQIGNQHSLKRQESTGINIGLVRLRMGDGKARWAIKDENGSYTSKNGVKYRLATQLDIQKAQFAARKNSNDEKKDKNYQEYVLKLNEVKTTGGHLGAYDGYVKASGGNWQMNGGDTGEWFTLDEVLMHSTGSKYNEQYLNRKNSKDDDKKIKKIEEAGDDFRETLMKKKNKEYVPIRDASTSLEMVEGNKVTRYDIYEIGGKRRAHRTGVWIIMPDGKRVMDSTYAAKMMEGDKKMSSSIVGQEHSVRISNIDE